MVFCRCHRRKLQSKPHVGICWSMADRRPFAKNCTSISGEVTALPDRPTRRQKLQRPCDAVPPCAIQSIFFTPESEHTCAEVQGCLEALRPPCCWQLRSDAHQA